MGPDKPGWRDQMGGLLHTYDLDGLPLPNSKAIVNWIYNVLSAGRGRRTRLTGAALALYQLMEEVLDTYPGLQQGMEALVQFMKAWLRTNGKPETKAAGNKKRKKDADDEGDPFESDDPDMPDMSGRAPTGMTAHLSRHD
jgi:hypothetical protein